MKMLDGIMGLVVGDALGVQVEFRSRERLKETPVTGMQGYGIYDVPKGRWSDDSSMALATLAALKYGIDQNRIIDNFVAWERNGEFTPAGEVFDEGITCRMAISNYIEFGDIKVCGMADEKSNGNGSLMRILPICVYLAGLQSRVKMNDDNAIKTIHDVSALTHAHMRSKLACGIYYFCVRSIMNRMGTILDLLQVGVDEAFAYYERRNESREELKYFGRIRDLTRFRQLPDEDINSGGYVIDSIEASLWCLLTTCSYAECVLKAVNLGQDTDTTAAIAGGLAGLYYGYDKIPEEWKQDIIRREWIERLCLDAQLN